MEGALSRSLLCVPVENHLLFVMCQLNWVYFGTHAFLYIVQSYDLPAVCLSQVSNPPHHLTPSSQILVLLSVQVHRTESLWPSCPIEAECSSLNGFMARLVQQKQVLVWWSPQLLERFHRKVLKVHLVPWLQEWFPSLVLHLCLQDFCLGNCLYISVELYLCLFPSKRRLS